MRPPGLQTRIISFTVTEAEVTGIAIFDWLALLPRYFSFGGV